MLRSLVILVVLATSLPTISVSAQSDPERAGVMFLFDENISTADEYLVRESIRFAQDYAIATLGTDVQRSFTVSVISDPYNLTNYAKDGTIHLNTATFSGYPPLIRTFFLVHEYFHLWQQDAAGDGRNVDSPIPASSLGPAWLLEGSADYIGLIALLETGIVSPEEINEFTVQMVNGAHNEGPPMLPELQELVAREDMIVPEAACCTYPLSELAIKLLVGDEGPDAVAAYYQALSESSLPWKTVFADSFGITIDDFYAQFEAQRPTLMQPTGLDVTQLLNTPYFNDVPTDIRLGGAPETIVPGDQVVLYAWGGDGSTCVMTVRDETAQEFTTYPTYADTYGLVVWLWSVPDSLPTGSLPVEMNCGGEPISISVEVI
jgi:hypothetical protein